MNFKKHFLKNKNFKFGYYVNSVFKDLIPPSYFAGIRDKIFESIKDYDETSLCTRVDYYNKLDTCTPIQHLSDVMNREVFSSRIKSKVYYFDFKNYLRYFDNDEHFLYTPGDNIDRLNNPSFVKSRQIDGSPNEILLKLNAVRHFNFIKDDISFEKKQDKLFGRMSIYQSHRKAFFQMHYNNPICDIGDVAKNSKSDWMKDKVSISDHLKYKYILALEGNDVATNLKWIMSSNSIAVMPKPRYETWFMEGRLIPDHHYICIKDDYSDLNERLDYYNTNINEAKSIVENANQWTEQFRDSKQELLLNLMVMDKYFKWTN